MASLSDIITVAQNIVTALNNAANTYLSVQGTQTARNITATTLVKSGTGRIVTCTVLASTPTDNGAIYDASSLTQIGAPNRLWTIWAANTAAASTSAPIVLNLPFSSGLVIEPGTGMTVSISYS